MGNSGSGLIFDKDKKRWIIPGVELEEEEAPPPPPKFGKKTEEKKKTSNKPASNWFAPSLIPTAEDEDDKDDYKPAPIDDVFS